MQGDLNMKIPKKVKVAGHVYDIEYPHKFTETSDIYGRVDFGSCEIMIGDHDSSGNECSESHADCVYWHEVLHIIDKIYCSFNVGEEIDKEDLVEPIAQGFYQVLTDNFEPLVPLNE